MGRGSQAANPLYDAASARGRSVTPDSQRNPHLLYFERWSDFALRLKKNGLQTALIPSKKREEIVSSWPFARTMSVMRPQMGNWFVKQVLELGNLGFAKPPKSESVLKQQRRFLGD